MEPRYKCLFIDHTLQCFFLSVLMCTLCWELLYIYSTHLTNTQMWNTNRGFHSSKTTGPLDLSFYSEQFQLKVKLFLSVLLPLWKPLEWSHSLSRNATMAPDNHWDRLRENLFVPERGKSFKESSASGYGWVSGQEEEVGRREALRSLNVSDYPSCPQRYPVHPKCYRLNIVEIM